MALRDSLLQSREELQELIEIGGDVVHSVELLPWQLEQKRRFVWIKVHGKLPGERESDDREVQTLLGSLTRDRNVDALSSTPFYADMLANEFRQDSSLSPQSEFDLLDLAVSAMCRREYAKEGPIQENVLSLESFREWLEEVAAEVVGQGGIPENELRNYTELILVLTDSAETSDTTAGAQLVDQMMVMPFLKSSPGSAKFEFTHEILGEFLAGSFYAKKMEDRTREVDWGSRYLGQQALPPDSMLLKVIACHFLEKREKLVEAMGAWPSTKTPGTVHRNIVQLCALMENGREILNGVGLSLEGADLRGVQFGSMDLHELSFVGSDLSHSDLSQCNLLNTRFESARLRDTFLPSGNTGQLKGAFFGGMKNFESIQPRGRKRIDSYEDFMRWAERGTEVQSGGDLPCPAAQQVAHLFGKFVRPNGDARRNRLDVRALNKGKQVKGGPGYGATVEKVQEFGYLELPTKGKASRPKGSRYGEMVQFMKNNDLSEGMSQLLASLCQRPGCQHVDRPGLPRDGHVRE